MESTSPSTKVATASSKTREATPEEKRFAEHVKKLNHMIFRRLIYYI